VRVKAACKPALTIYPPHLSASQMHWIRRSFLRHACRAKAYCQASAKMFHASSRMSSASTSTMLYAASIASSQVPGAVPEEAKELQHHLKDGKGFQNPWPSYKEFTPFSIMKSLIVQVALMSGVESSSADGIQAQVLRREQLPRHDPTNCSCHQAFLPTKSRDSDPQSNMARTRLLLCRVSRRVSCPV